MKKPPSIVSLDDSASETLISKRSGKSARNVKILTDVQEMDDPERSSKVTIVTSMSRLTAAGPMSSDTSSIERCPNMLLTEHSNASADSSKVASRASGTARLRSQLSKDNLSGVQSQPSPALSIPVTPVQECSKSSFKPPKSTPAVSKKVIISRWIVESKYFIALTTVLTIFALCGDDLRLFTTNKPADVWFNTATAICLAIFSIEIVLSCIGKDDYFFSFFFGLDTVSTVTMLMDITVISDFVGESLVMQGDDELGADSSHGYDAAQLAKAGRVVRVLRLVRILKLYKALHEAKKAKKRKDLNGPGDEDPWDDVLFDDAILLQQESRVGKRLSDMTTQRVIMLVLIMLLVLPFLTADESLQLPEAPNYGADVVRRAFLRHLQNRSAASKMDYELTMLQYVYYSNWFVKAKDDEHCPFNAILCSTMYLSHLFWVGIISRNSTLLVEMAREAAIEPVVLDSWEANISMSTDLVYSYGSMPQEASTIISSRWDADCRIDTQTHRLGFSLLEEEVSGYVTYAARCPDDLRKAERILYSPRLLSAADATEWNFVFYYDLRWYSQQLSMYGMITTLFVLSVLTGASLAFANDANTLVLYPVEKMISKVEIIRDKPLMAMKMADDDFKAEELQKARNKELQEHPWTRLKDTLCCHKNSDKRQEPMETVVLEKTIIKLGSLLALGFGEAGANIIEHNMHGIDSACVDAMVEGTRVECVIGIVRIRHFGLATEVLQQRVTTFVNQVVEIVHGVVNEFNGAPNKSSGDMFLVIWRSLEREEEETLTKMADMSMLAFSRILGAVHRSPVLAEYRTHPGLQLRLGKHLRVNLSFGLHAGWAIEGAVGSEFKIDASYLSPNVNISENVERATKVYGVSLLVAESLVELCSTAMATKCRRIDRVLVPGSRIPMDLFAIDLDCMCLTVDHMTEKLVWNSKQRFRVRQFMEQEKLFKWCKEYSTVSSFNEHPDVAAMRFRFTPEFVHVYAMGFENYSQGEWTVARRFLERTKTMLGMEDGPSKALLKFIEGYGFQAPNTWKGWRELKFSS